MFPLYLISSGAYVGRFWVLGRYPTSNPIRVEMCLDMIAAVPNADPSQPAILVLGLKMIESQYIDSSACCYPSPRGTILGPEAGHKDSQSALQFQTANPFRTSNHSLQHVQCVSPF